LPDRPKTGAHAVVKPLATSKITVAPKAPSSKAPKVAPPVPTISAIGAEPPPKPAGATADGAAAPLAGSDNEAAEVAEDAVTDEHQRSPRLPAPGKSLGVAPRKQTKSAPASIAKVSAATPNEIRSEDTAALISGLAAELVLGESMQNLSVDDDEAEETVSVPSSAASRARAAALVASPDPRPASRFSTPMLAAIGAAVVLLPILGFIAFSGGDDEPEIAADVGQEVADASGVTPEPTGAAAQPETAPAEVEDPAPVPVPSTEPPSPEEAGTEADSELVAEPPPPDLPTEAEAVAEDPLVAAAKPKRSGKGKGKGKKKDKPTADPTPAPAAKPKPKPKPKPSDPNASKSAKELAKEAKSALSKGQAKHAYGLAKSSYSKSAKSGTAETMTLAACKMGDKGKAASALKKVSKIKHPVVKSKCKKSGVNL
jgi:hypothetical protein